MTKNYNFNQGFLYMLITSATFISFIITLVLQSSVMNLVDLEFIAQNSDSSMYFSLFNKTVSYDILTPKSDYLLLSRYRQPHLYQAILHLNYSLAYDFEEVTTTSGDNKLIMSTEGKNLILGINGDKLPISFDSDIMTSVQNGQYPVNFGNDFSVTDFNFKEITDNFVFNKLKEIPLIVSSRATEENRFLRNAVNVKHAEGYNNKEFINCIVRLTDKSYTLEHQAVEGVCPLNGVDKTVLGFAGMNAINVPTYSTDILTVLNSITDNFENSYNQYARNEPLKSYLSQTEKKTYDYIVGHSKGGAISLFAVINNKIKARNIITFGAPLTRKTGLTIPTTQFIKSKDDFKGCCVYSWWGGCNQRGISDRDVITEVAIGTHINQVINGDTKFLGCKSSLPMNFYNNIFTLHIPFVPVYGV